MEMAGCIPPLANISYRELIRELDDYEETRWFPQYGLGQYEKSCLWQANG